MSRATPPVLRVEGVSKKFCRSLRRSLRYGLVDVALELGGRGGGERPLRKDEFWALRDISFDLHPGDCLGLIGHNGAGKTTLLRMLAGLIKPDGGRIEARGKIAAMIALGAGFNPALTGRENIHVNGALLGMTRAEISRKLDWIVDFSGLGTFIDAPVQTYSSGMNVRLGFSIAIAVQPDVLILDEVLAVGDMEFRTKCQAQLNVIRDAGGALILVSHSMEQIAHHCNRAILLRSGSIQAHGSPDQAIHAYLSLDGENMFALVQEGDAQSNTSEFELQPHYNPEENRWGDRRAQIVDIELSQRGQLWPSTLVPGALAAITLTVRFNEDIQHPIYGLTIKNEAGAQVFNTNSQALAGFNGQPGVRGDIVKITFEFEPHLPLGEYLISLGIASENASGIAPHDRRYDCLRVRFTTPKLSSGEADFRPRVFILGPN